MKRVETVHSLFQYKH